VTGDVRQFVVKVLEVFDPMGLLTSNLLWLMEILEILVISADLDGVHGSKEKGTATFEPKENGSEFLVVGIVILFGRKEASGMEGDGVNPVIKFLRDDGS
jgi:hypothetical protein